MGVAHLEPETTPNVPPRHPPDPACSNMRVLNSYWICEDSTYKWYEVILVDPAHKAIRTDPRINWICNGVHAHRECRGLTSAGKKHRGLRNKGGKSKAQRPSVRAVRSKRDTLSLKRYR